MTRAPRLLSDAERIDWLRLSRSENIGPITFFQLLERFGTAGEAIAAVPRLAQRGGRVRPIKILPKSEAEREIEECDRVGAELVAWSEPDYPAALAAIADPPPLIAVFGHRQLLIRDALAIVGARNASANGLRFTRRIAAELGESGLVIVSGLARGIDGAGHQGALETGTIAVMAGGIDIVYPPEHRELYDAIGERGAIIAEMAVGTVPQARHFPRRNRLISGLSRGVLVVEAAPRSGSLITARLALDQGREVFAVPGSPLDPRCRGTNNLIRQGAVLAETAEDVLSVLRESERVPLTERETLPFDEPKPAPADESELDRARPILVDMLGPTPVPVDELIRQSRLTAPVVATILLELELAERLDRHPGNQVSLIISNS